MSPTVPCQANSETTCDETPVIAEPVSLCEEHALQVSLHVVPGLLSRRLAETRSRNEDGTEPLSPAATHMVSSAVSMPMPETETHSSLVYFLANGGRVKIGQTRGLYSRTRSLSLRADAVLLLLQGGASLERALHAKFAAHRIGDSEWFDLTPEIVRFVGTKAHSKPLRKPATGPRRSSRTSPASRQEREVELVIALMRDLGFEKTSLAVVKDRLGMPQTTAWDRLKRARDLWTELEADAS